MFQISVDNLNTIEFDQIVLQINRFLCGPLKNLPGKTEFITNYDDLLFAHNQVNELITLINYANNFPLVEFESVEQILPKIKPENSRLNPNEYISLARQYELVHQIKNQSNSEEVKTPLFNILCKQFYIEHDIIKSIRKTIDETGSVNDHASPELKQIRRKLIGIDSKLRSTTKDLASKKYKSFLIDSETTVRNGRLVLSVKSEHVNEINGLIVDHSATGATVYIEPNESIKLSNEYQSLVIDEQKEIDRILKVLTDQIRPFINTFYLNETTLNELDVIHAKALFGIKYKCCFPAINRKDYRINLTQAFHPILLQSLKREEIEPLDIQFGDQDCRIVLISGPNAGGKTVAIKTIGLLQLMFQSAIPIPCNIKSSLPIFRKFFCDIGDNQSILNDLSTFSSHISHIKDILKNASVETLILIDELGTGTDPKEGAALSQAILNRFLSLGAKVIATSHLGDLKIFANNSESIVNASMQFNDIELKSTYKLQMGIPGQSNAFVIAERLGIEKRIVDAGRALMDDSELHLEDLISELNQKINKNEELKLELSMELDQSNKLKTEFSKKLEMFNKFESEKRQEAIDRAELLLRDVNRTIENSVQRIRESQAGKEVVREVKIELRNIRSRIQNEKKQKSNRKISTKKLEIGDQVRHSDYSTIGEIISVNGKRYQVQIGHFKMDAFHDDLEFIRSKSEVEKNRNSSINYSNIKTHVTNEIDVRGLDFDDAWLKCDEYLEYANNSGWASVSIIHGKGTGVLRQKLNEQLRHDKRIQSKRFGNTGEGDMGVTIVTLKK